MTRSTLTVWRISRTSPHASSSVSRLSIQLGNNSNFNIQGFHPPPFYIQSRVQKFFSTSFLSLKTGIRPCQFIRSLEIFLIKCYFKRLMIRTKNSSIIKNNGPNHSEQSVLLFTFTKLFIGSFSIYFPKLLDRPILSFYMNIYFRINSQFNHDFGLETKLQFFKTRAKTI